MYWVTERKATASLQCDYRSDIPKMPTGTRKGQLQAGNNRSFDTKPVPPGSDCLCQEDGSVWLLGKETDAWKEL